MTEPSAPAGHTAEEVVAIPATCLTGAALDLPGLLVTPPQSRGIVLFAHGSGSGLGSPRNRFVAGAIQRAGLATLLFDLLSAAEGADRRLVFDIPLLADRLGAAVGWIARRSPTRALPIGLFGASTGAAAALVVAAREPRVAAVVSRGGRADLAGAALSRVHAPTLLVVGSRDEEVLELNRRALLHLGGRKELAIVRGATHLFEEEGALAEVAALAAEWFRRYLLTPSASADRVPPALLPSPEPRPHAHDAVPRP